MKYQKDDLAKFPDQISYALKNYKAHGLKVENYDNIILSGLGGSGIAGRIAKSVFYKVSSLPIEVISDYELPSYASKRTLAIMSSYSGNTEETLAMYAQAKSQGCTIVAITTGGKLAELAAADNFTIYNAEKGFQPRMALGYSLTFLIQLFGELFGVAYQDSLKAVSAEVSNIDKYIASGQKIFDSIKNNFPNKLVVVADFMSHPVGLRFCQQIQENAKAEAFLHELPECNHNVIESYYGKMDSVFIFLNSGSNARTSLRFEFLSALLKKNGNTLVEMNVGNTVESMMENIYVLDWLSLIIADSRGVNSSLIENINGLKEFLGSR